MPEKNMKAVNAIQPRMSSAGKLTLGVGVAVLVAGYMFLATGSMTLAPVLIIGGLVTIVIGIYNL